MKLKIITLLCILGLSAPLANASDVKLVNSIIAVVGNDVITQKQFNLALKEVNASLPKNTKIDKDEILEQLINQSLIVQAGQRQNVKANNTEIDNKIIEIAKTRRISVDALYSQMQKNGLSRNIFRDKISQQIIAEKVQQRILMQSSNVSESEINAYIANANQNGIKLPIGDPVREYHARHILLKAENDQAAKATESEIRKIYNEARSGINFSSLARQYSQDSSANDGGDLGWFSDGVMVPEFENAVHNLKAGQISQPIRSQFGWHIIQLEEVRENNNPEQLQRNGVRQYIIQEKAQNAMQKLLQDLHNANTVKIRQ